MIPSMDVLDTTIEEVEIPTNNYKIIIDKDRVNGYTDGLAAVEQAVYLIFNTERYQFIIYDWDYGVEFVDLIGQPMTYVIPEVERRVTEALLQDDRIISVDNFQFEVNHKQLYVKFIVTCDYGRLEIEREVPV